MDSFFIVTGGPGAGKSTLIDALAALGHGRTIEAGRFITQQQVAIGGHAVHWGDRRLYAELMLMHEIRSFSEARGLTFFDRGIPELGEYLAMSKLPPAPHFERAAQLYRYNRMVFAAPPWQEIYVNDAERKQDFDEAIASYRHCLHAYRERNYEVLELPKASVDARVRFVLDAVADASSRTGGGRT